MKTYYVYHIQKRQEWGCTTNLNRRLKQLGYSVNDVVEVLSFTNIDEAADTERQLNIRDGYGWNTGRDYRNIIKNQKQQNFQRLRLHCQRCLKTNLVNWMTLANHSIN